MTIKDTRNILSLKQRIQRLITNVNRSYDSLMQSNGISDSHFEEQGRMYDELEAINKKAGEGLAIGRMLKFPVADGYALYIVVKINKNEVIVEHIPLGDAYIFMGVYQNANDKLAISRGVAEKNIAMIDGMNRIFGRKQHKKQ